MNGDGPDAEDIGEYGSRVGTVRNSFSRLGLALLWGMLCGALHDGELRLLGTVAWTPGFVFLISLGLIGLPFLILCTRSYGFNIFLAFACTIGTAIGMLTEQGCGSLLGCLNRVSNFVAILTGAFVFVPAAILVTYVKRRRKLDL
jgi:hypothetical protein